MKSLILNIVLCISCTLCFGQDSDRLNNLIEKGIGLHDRGQYNDAIDAYLEAYKINPKSAMVNYELSLTYMYLEDYENVIKHSNLVIELGDKDFLPLAYNALGSALDNLGRVDESIKVFEKALKELGDNYLIYYNLALNYFKLKDYNKACEMAMKGLGINPSHASSHLLLGNSMQTMGQSVQSELCFYFFLFLEGETQRSQDVFASLLYEMGKSVKKDPNAPNNINITLNNSEDKIFRSISLILALSEASRSTEGNKNKTTYQAFYDNTELLFSTLSAFKEDEKNIWWEFYVPFFSELHKSGHLDAYCRYISQMYWQESVEWIKSNPEKLNAFVAWLDSEYKWN